MITNQPSSPQAQTEQQRQKRVDERRQRRHSYHLAASLYSRHLDIPDEDPDYYASIVSSGSRKRHAPATPNERAVETAKADLIAALAAAGGDETCSRFRSSLDRLSALYDPSKWDARADPRKVGQGSSKHERDPSRKGGPTLEGMWLTLTKPKFDGCLGKNERGEYMYTLGRMSFDMFRPTKLICSIQGTFNPVHVVRKSDREVVKFVPKKLIRELRNGNTVLRTYNVVTAFTIEPENPVDGPASPNRAITRPIRGVLTTYGYVLPDPENSHRLSIWFTGGRIEVNDDDTDTAEWKRIFADDGSLPKRELKEKAHVLAARALLGARLPGAMEEDGTMSYNLHRPLGGHGSAYVDVLFMDETLRVVRGSKGALYIFARVPDFPNE